MVAVQLPPFARLLRRARLEAELTQEELATRAGLSSRAISDLERGVKTRPHRATVELLADALHLRDDDRAALLGAVPRRSMGCEGTALASEEDWSVTGGLAWAQEGDSLPWLRKLMDGVVGLYSEEDRATWQVKVTVVTLSLSASQVRS